MKRLIAYYQGLKPLNQFFVITTLIGILLGAVSWIPFLTLLSQKPYLSIKSIEVPHGADRYSTEFSLINPSNKVYHDLLIVINMSKDFKLNPGTVVIEPKQHKTFIGRDNFRFDENYHALYLEDNGLIYIRIKILKATEKLDFDINFIKLEGFSGTINLSISYSNFSHDSWLPYNMLMSMGSYQDCNKEENPPGIKEEKARRFNLCHGGVYSNYSNYTKLWTTLTFFAWIFPEWNKESNSIILDSGPELHKNRINIYYWNSSMYFNVVESNEFLHILNVKVNFKDGWNHLAYSIDTKRKNLLVYLNGEELLNYYFSELTIQIPEIIYFGRGPIDREDYIGHFIMSNPILNNQTLTSEIAKYAADINNPIYS